MTRFVLLCLAALVLSACIMADQKTYFLATAEQAMYVYWAGAFEMCMQTRRRETVAAGIPLLPPTLMAMAHKCDAEAEELMRRHGDFEPEAVPMPLVEPNHRGGL